VYLGSIPAGFLPDELFESYQAHSIMETGKDLAGRASIVPYLNFGNTIRVLPVYAYSTMPVFYLLGVSVYSARLVSAIYGTLTVFMAYLLSRKMFNEQTGLLTAALLAISPWHFFLSRVSFGFIALPFFFISGIYLLYRGLEEDGKYIIYSVVPFALTFYNYGSAWLFVPLFLVLTLWIYRKKLSDVKANLMLALTVGFILVLPLLYCLYVDQDTMTNRYGQTSIFNPRQKVPEKMREYLKGYTVPSFIEENNAFMYALEFMKNYFLHVSPSFLFLKGTPDTLILSVGVFGELHLFELPLIIAGVYIFIKRRERKHLIVLMWLLTFSIPANFNTSINDIFKNPHPGRTINVIPAFEMLAACGFLHLAGLETKHKRIKSLIIAALIVLALYNIVSYFTYYFMEYPRHTVNSDFRKSPFYTNVGDALSYVKNMQDDYDRVILTKNCCNFQNYYIAFFTGQNVSEIHAEPTGVYKNHIGKFIYSVNASNYCYINKGNPLSMLYIIREGDLPPDEFTTLRAFNNPDGTVSFKVGLCNPHQ
jgi:hypothetical protein